MMPRGCSSIARAVPRVLALACALALLGPAVVAWGRDLARAPVTRAGAPPWEEQGASSYSATLEQCLTSATPEARSVTFAGQMTAVPGTQRMGMRIVLQERAAGESSFHDVTAPGLGVWRGSEPGVKIYRYVKQITNLSAPAAYRALVRFRWLGEKGRVLRRAELRTARCVQPLIPGSSAEAGTEKPPAG